MADQESVSDPVPSLPRVMTPKMVAEVWFCSETHVRKLIASGELRAFKVGNSLWRVLGTEVEKFERRHLVSPQARREPGGEDPEPNEPQARATRLDPMTRARLDNLRRNRP